MQTFAILDGHFLSLVVSRLVGLIIRLNYVAY